MANKPTYEELEQRVKDLEKTIKKRHQAEKRLQERNSLLHDVLEGTTDSIFVKDRQSRYILLNTETAHGLGKASVEEVIGKSDTEFIHSEQARKLREHDIGIMTSGKSTIREEVVGTTDSPRIYQTMKAPRYDHTGNVIGVIGIARDITDQKRIETALRENEKNYRLMFETMVSGFALLEMMYDESGKPIDCRYIEANPAHEKLTGLKTTEIIDRTARESIPGLEDSWIKDYGQVDRTGKPMEIENYVEGLKSWYKVFAYRTKPGFVAVTFENITDSKRAEETLRESEEKYRSLTDDVLDNSAVGIFILDSDFRVVWVNQALEGYFGLERDEIIGKDKRQLIRKRIKDIFENPGGFADKVFSTYDNNTYTECFQCHVLPDGERQERWLEHQSYPIQSGLYAGGRIEHYYDITAMKQAQATLLESEEKYRATLRSTPDTVAISRVEDGRFLELNDGFTRMFGYSREEAIGKTVTELDLYLAHTDRDRLVEALSTQEEVNELEFTYRRKDRTLFKGMQSARPIRFGDDDCLISVVKDISSLGKAQKALRESEGKYRLLIENATDAIFIAQDGRLTFANPKAEEMIGYSAEELTKVPFVDHIHPEDRDMVLERHLKRLKGEEIARIYSFRIINKSGEELSVELNAVLIEWEGRPATLNFLRDITTQERLEAQLQQAQKMEAIGTLGGGIAHDFNNLLMAIQGRTSIMLTKKESSHPDIGHLKGIEDNVESAADLTRQLLGFARGGKYEVRPTDLNELVKKQNRMFGRTKKEISIRGKYEENLWSVEVDRGQIEQVLLNLYVNAWQAMPAGGELYLETENVTLDENYVKPFSIEPGKYVKISVTDTGTGMDKTTRKKIFDPFFTTKETGRGTGLGLASVYGIIKNHHGFINVYSEKGHGTTFNIYLPVSEKEIIEEKKPAGDTLRGSETVLFVDDEDMIIEVAEEMFEQLGYKLLIARSGKEAIETYEKNKELIDIVLLDMIMPDMSGSDTYDRMKEFNPDIKVLLASGYSINGQATEIMDRGCSGFIQKPFKMKELSQKLREILDKK